MRPTGFLGLGLVVLAVGAATNASLYSGVLTSEAVQAPRISLDMDPAGNIYDPATNTMSVGAVDACLASEVADPGTHVHTAHLVVHNVEDLIAWQARLNYDPDRMRPTAFNFAPFTDTTTGQGVSFANLPKDSPNQLHRDIWSAISAGWEPWHSSVLAGAGYWLEQAFPISPDTPAKIPPDDASYTAEDGGVLAAVNLEVVGDQSGQTLSMQLDDDNPNPPGSDFQVFDGIGIRTISVPESDLSSGYHAEGATACAPVPTPTNEPLPSPFPEPTPGPQTPPPGETPTPGATPAPFPAVPTCSPSSSETPQSRFNPQVCTTYSDTSPGSHPDIATGLSLGVGPDGLPGTADDTNDYGFAGIVSFASSSPQDSGIPDGAILGGLRLQPALGLINNPCSNTQLRVDFTLMEGTTDITNTVEPLPHGSNNDLAIISGDSPPFDGVADVIPPPAVTKYPSFLNAIFDPDWVDYGPDRIAGNEDDTNGPQPPLRPRFRSVGVTSIQPASNLWVIRQELVFEPGTKLPNLPAFDPSLGHPIVTVQQQSSAAGSATPEAPSAITDLCTPLKEHGWSYGLTQDNPGTPPYEGGIPVRILSDGAGTPVAGLFYAVSQRDADDDGYENTIDTCPFHADTVWNPRDPAHPIEGDSDVFLGLSAPDGIPDTCDPTPEEPTWMLPGTPVDHDGDGFPNRGDNCPLHYNPDQADRDRNAEGEEAGDGIGDVCDTPETAGGVDVEGRPIPVRSVAGNGPDVPDGEAIVCARTLTVTVGGPNDAEVSDCQDALPGVPVCSCAPVETPIQQTDPVEEDDSAATPAAAPTPAVAGVTALPRTGDGAGGALPRSMFVLAVAVGAAAVAVAGRLRKGRRARGRR